MNDEKKELRKTEEILNGKFMTIDGKKTLLDLAIYICIAADCIFYSYKFSKPDLYVRTNGRKCAWV